MMRTSVFALWTLLFASLGDVVMMQSAQTWTECGGEITGQSGEVVSPNYPEDYPTNVDCEYHITVDEGQVIRVSFADFQLEDSSSCQFDSLSLSEGDQDFGTYCGTNTPPTVVTDGNQITIVFHSDEADTAAGWKMLWIQTQPGVPAECVFPFQYNGVQYDTCIDDGSGAYWCSTTSNYDIDGGYVNCVGYQPSCQFPFQYQGEEYNHCIDNGNSGQMWCSTTYDYDTDGAYINCPSYNLNEAFMIKYENYNHPNCVFPFEYYGVSFNSCITVNSTTPWCSPTPVYEIGSGTSETCFYQEQSTTTIVDTTTLPPTTTQVPGCGADVSGENGELSSPNFGLGNYENGLNCEYHITVAEGKSIKIEFTDFELEDSTLCWSDSVYIVSNTVDHGNYCGTELPPVIYTDGNQATITFSSDFAVNFAGWRLVWNEYEEGADDAFILESEESDGLWGEWGDIEECPQGQYVYGYQLMSEEEQGTGDDTALNTVMLYCGAPNSADATATITSTAGEWGTYSPMTFCEGSNNNPVVGFKLMFESYQGEEGDDTAANKVDLFCQDGQHLSAETNTEYGDWSSDLICPTGKAVVGIQTRVEAYLGESGDDTSLNGVRLVCRDYEDSDAPVPTTTPTVPPTTIPTSSGYFICNIDHMEAASEWNDLYSTNYPNMHENNEDCGVSIHSRDGNVHLEIVSFHLESMWDKVLVYDGGDDQADLLAEWTGEIFNGSVMSSGPFMYIRYSSDSGGQRTGFHLRFNSAQAENFICNHEYMEATSEWTDLYSTNYPDMHNNEEDCGVSIYSAYGNVHLEIISFHLENGYDKVWVYDGSDDQADLLAEWTGEMYYGSAISSGPYMYIRYHSDAAVQNKGFHFQFTSAQEVMDPCDSNPCGQGSCMSHGDMEFTCYCSDGTHGLTCHERFFTTSFEMSFEEAKAYCEQNGASLVQVQNEDKFNEVISWMTSNQYENWFWTGMEYTNEGPILTDGSTAYVQWVPEAPHSLDFYPDNTKLMIQSTGNWNWSPQSGNNGKPLCETPDHECPGELVYSSCGSACPNVCGMEPVDACMEVCVAGCQCPHNTFRTTDDRCVPAEECPTDTDGLHCEQYDGLTGSCNVRKAWLCHYAEWRMHFYTVWMRQYMDQSMDPVMPDCIIYEDMVQCRNPEMKVCHESAIPNCPVCYCSDHQYQQADQLNEAYRLDNEVWKRMMREWQPTNNGDNTC